MTLTTNRIVQRRRWARLLREVLTEMEVANEDLDQSDDVEALVRVAWLTLYREAKT